MISVARLEFNPIQENTYVVWDETGECVVVDAGCYNARERQVLASCVADKGLRPVLAVNTHGHFDHTFGVDWVKTTYGVPFAIDFRDNFLLESLPMQGRMFGFEFGSAPVAEIDLGGEAGSEAAGCGERASGSAFLLRASAVRASSTALGLVSVRRAAQALAVPFSAPAEVRFGRSMLQVIHTPGHTPGHVCLYDPEGGMLLTGDTLFKESIGRTDLPGGDYSWIMKSILERIVPLGEGVRILPGHGPESTIGHELLYNPFIVEVLQGQVVPAASHS